MVLATRVTFSQSPLATATPKRVVLPDMNDMNSCENSRNPMESAQPARAASAMAKGIRVRGSAGKDLSAGGSGFAPRPRRPSGCRNPPC